MTAASLMLCTLWCGDKAVFGAATAPAGAVAVHAGAGLSTVVPTLWAGVVVGVTPWLDASFRYDTYALILHVPEIGARLRLSDGLGARLAAGYGFFVVGKLAGTELAQSPVGAGLTVDAALLLSHRAGGVSLGFAVGASTRWVDGAGDVGLVVRGAKGEITAEWSGESGATFLHVGALFPIQAELRVLGYFPTVVVGRTFLFP